MMHYFFLFLFVGALVNADNKTHLKPLCTRCECLGIHVMTVDCDNAALKEIPEVEQDLKSPWGFQVRRNSITTIRSFPKLENLTFLYLGSNKISIIDDYAFVNLTNLESLELSNNNLTAKSFRPDSFTGRSLQSASLPLKILDLSSNHLNRLPKSIFVHLVNLTKLDLSHNPFVDFSRKTAEAISELRKLQHLDLSYTKLQRLPDHFFAELTSLLHLDLSGNDFISVPAEVNYARSLTHLVINNNTFGMLYGHSFWKDLKNLKTLELCSSTSMFRIEDGAFANLTSLEILKMNNNPQLSILMSRAFINDDNETPHLEELHLRNNLFKGLPEDALPWNDIPLLDLRDNPWNCNCHLEWLAKGVMITMMDSDKRHLTYDVTCAYPPELLGLGLTASKVQSTKLSCRDATTMQGYGFLVLATIVVGILLLVTGTIMFSYILFRRTKVQDWFGDNVKYRRTQNDDEEIVTSATQY